MKDLIAPGSGFVNLSEDFCDELSTGLYVRMAIDTAIEIKVNVLHVFIFGVPVNWETEKNEKKRKETERKQTKRKQGEKQRKETKKKRNAKKRKQNSEKRNETKEKEKKRKKT